MAFCNTRTSVKMTNWNIQIRTFILIKNWELRDTYVWLTVRDIRLLFSLQVIILQALLDKTVPLMGMWVKHLYDVYSTQNKESRQNTLM